jgi:MFS family permease
MTETTKRLPNPPALVRWAVLVFTSLAMFGNYYVYDSISPLADLLASRLNFTDADIGTLNAIYSLPNIVMVVIGGLLIDRLGPRRSSFIFSILCMLGALVTALTPEFYIMVIGRLIFGLGAESLIVAITTIIARWFKGNELSFAFGLNLTIARLGTFTALNSPTWGAAFYNSWQGPLLVSVGAAVLSVLSIIIYMTVDSRSEKRYFLGDFENQDKIDLRQVFVFSRSFWLITLLCVTFYSAIFPFQTFAVKFFIQDHFTSLETGVARSVAGFLTSLLILTAMIMTPIFGLLADKIGKRASLMLFGSLMLIPVYLIMTYVKVDPEIPQSLAENLRASVEGDGGFLVGLAHFFYMIRTLVVYYPNLLLTMAVMGLSFSLIPAVMWPSVALIVEDNKLGTAYGFMTMIQNVGLTGFNFLIGWANDFSGGYTMGMWIFSSLGFFGLLFAWLLRRQELGPDGHGLENVTRS